MSKHTKWRIMPWEWDDVPLFWRDWILIDYAVDADLSHPTEKG